MNERSKILVVDDDKTILNYLSNVLEQQEFSVLVAETGAKALELLEVHRDISVVLLDIIMPGMSGLEVLERVKANSSTASIKVIMVSGKSDVTEKVKAFSLGASDYIEKPFASDELIIRVQTQARLQKTENELLLFKTIIESSKEAIAISDQQKRLVYVNSAFENLFEISSEEVLGKDFRYCYTPSSFEHFKQEACPVIERGEGWEGELEVINSDGRCFPIWQRVGSTSDEKGDILNNFCFMHDISERIEMVESWRKNTFMANASKDFMTLINRDYIYEAANDAYCQALNSKREEIVGRSMNEIWNTKFNNMIKNYVDLCFTGQEVHYEEWFEFGGVEKQCFDVFYYPYYASNNQITHIVVVSKDITERKKVEQSLRESQQYVQRIADTQPDILFIYNIEQKKFEYSNRQVTRVLGYNDIEIIKDNFDGFYAYLHPDDKARVYQRKSMLNYATDQEIIDTEYRLVDKNGVWHWFYDRSTVYSRTPGGRTRQVLGILQDITKKKETEKALRMYQLQLSRAEKMAAVGRLFAAIMHEINNPLQAVQSCLSLITEEINLSGDTSKIKDYLDVASSEVDRISEVILRSRIFYHPIQGQQQDLGDQFYRDVQFVDVDLNELIIKVIKLVQTDINKNHISILYEVNDDEQYIVQGHHDSLEQVLMNLIINAIDAMETESTDKSLGGTILVKLSRELVIPRPGNQQRHPMVRLEISDSGIGMTKEVLERAFEPFFTTKEHGSGLGLATCHQIIQVHKGIIEMESEPGMGTSVNILLPENPTEKG